ncbi:Cytidine and dCMP deaminase domain-containing protein 1 [Podochytrium sp. JEL0797]|nr:Cytidine and dCMP deaminase domain-containing protein 1 [Podochytrium sp. JEL0797]
MEKHPTDPPTAFYHDDGLSPSLTHPPSFSPSPVVSPSLTATRATGSGIVVPALRTGAVLVDALGRVAAIERTGHSHAAVRCLMSCAGDVKALTLFIPQWDHGDIDSPTFLPPSSPKASSSKPVKPRVSPPVPEHTWPLDPHLATSTGIARRFPVIQLKFARTCMALNAVAKRYHVRARGMEEWRARYDSGGGGVGEGVVELGKEDERAGVPVWARHAMVLAHIAAKRTDDPKLGVGSVLVDREGRYFSVGWNGYPKKSQHLDYPQAGADDSVEYEELKYDYILHSEQNALLWRNPPGVRMEDSWVVVTKLPCDECSPMLHDCGFQNCITIPQLPKHADDPARLRGLTYNRVVGLMKRVILFEV